MVISIVSKEFSLAGAGDITVDYGRRGYYIDGGFIDEAQEKRTTVRLKVEREKALVPAAKDGRNVWELLTNVHRTDQLEAVVNVYFGRAVVTQGATLLSAKLNIHMDGSVEVIAEFNERGPMTLKRL